MFRRMLWVVSLSVLLGELTACQRGEHKTAGIRISATMPWYSYVQAKLVEKVDKTGKPTFTFPVLLVYNKAGVLVYEGHDTAGNTDALAKLSSGELPFHVEAGAQLTTLIDKIPEFQSRKSRLIEPHNMSAVSIFLESCHACSMQEETITTMEQRLLAERVNLLMVHVLRPDWYYK